ncbi:MAG: RNA polymerase sigma factor [Acidobacteria bacterium]|nr:RNA polymerase sigma factor [Acidobacteriota bacterium]
MSQPADRSPGFEELARQYAHLIRAVVGRVAGPAAGSVADDVEQQVLMALWKVTNAGEQIIHHPASYIYRVAVRETVRLLRDEHRRKEVAAAAWEMEDTGVPDMDRIVEGRELGRLIAKTLQELTGDRRRAVQAHLAGFSVREIMEMFDWPYNKARNLIARGMADLRRGLRTRGIDG